MLWERDDALFICVSATCRASTPLVRHANTSSAEPHTVSVRLLHTTPLALSQSMSFRARSSAAFGVVAGHRGV